MKENTLYVERFRPTELKYYVGNENVKESKEERLKKLLMIKEIVDRKIKELL